MEDQARGAPETDSNDSMAAAADAALEVARIALTMASGLLPYTSGQVVQADGGLLSVRY